MIFKKLKAYLLQIGLNRPPDFIVGGYDNPYMFRWFVIPRNRWFNVYLHNFRRSDDDRALHDHPWVSMSVLLAGNYVEETIAAGGIHHRKRLFAGAVRVRLSGKFAHRIEVEHPCWTLFMTGPRYREWGFHCPEQGWVHWQKFTDPADYGDIGKGCGV